MDTIEYNTGANNYYCVLFSLCGSRAIMCLTYLCSKKACEALDRFHVLVAFNGYKIDDVHVFKCPLDECTYT